MKEILNIEHVKKYYSVGDNIVKAVDDVSFKVRKREFVAIMGSSGSGKTTMLNIISSIDNADSGNIIISGDNIVKLSDKQLAAFRRKKLGFVFQDFNLLDSLTIGENIAFTLAINKEEPKKIDEIVKGIAAKIGIEGILSQYPYQVSGGQKQRCACARALANNPELILADEPTGALDSKSSTMLLETFNNMQNEFNSTILMVTHDVYSASYAERILLLKDGMLFKELVRNDRMSRKQYMDFIFENTSEE